MTDMTAPGKNWQVILTLVLSALGCLLFAVQALSLGVLWLLAIVDANQTMPESMSLGLLFWTSILGGLLLIPLLVLSIYALQGKPSPAWLDLHNPLLAKLSHWVILLWPLVVLLGWLVAGQERLAMLFLGPINLLVVGIPILWIYQAAQHGLPGGPPMRKWRIFGFSIALLPIIIILAELLVLIVLGGMGVIWLALRLMLDPGIEQQLMQLANQATNMGQDIDAIIDAFGSFLLQPSLIFWALAILGGILPIIEEVLKPISLWGLAGRKITAQEGFVGGLLCGAGFALMENVFYFTTVLLAEDWLLMAIGRAGTGVLHMLASGLVGWGLARAWRDGKWAFLGLTTLGAFFLHGLWNVLAVVSGVTPLIVLDTEPTLGQTSLFYLPLILLLMCSVLILYLINRHLRGKTPLASGGENEI